MTATAPSPSTASATQTALPDAEGLRREFLGYWATVLPETPAGQEAHASARQAVFLQLPRLELARLGQEAPALDEEAVRRSLASVNERVDCADFTMAALLRVLYRYGDSPLLSGALKGEIERTVLDFKYWIHEANHSTHILSS